MKENITEIMNELKLGQVIIMNGKEYVFIEPKRTRAVVCERGSNKEFLIKGYVCDAFRAPIAAASGHGRMNKS